MRALTAAQTTACKAGNGPPRSAHSSSPRAGAKLSLTIVPIAPTISPWSSKRKFGDRPAPDITTLDARGATTPRFSLGARTSPAAKLAGEKYANPESMSLPPGASRHSRSSLPRRC
eukprot:CAMPEP_0198356988 /NCGR_PEP_ID=MMETSP1450-20131203/124932_1 /TAXON_ID=753684 ORGANISM="Madagascaria erythrocladiodes, Strain CCMP3234" /NCGR_SAMPLE_ID=MMETSP1450 /ASSEMBLY_ACC=CAM_ASM_001115 /LENGTH=115 /DNA_ID=CAMNT_0044063549 /DNA_START=206 /DNA_END=553 /DNA_ORIENTATION=-